MADWHGTKGMWVDRMLHLLCDFQCPPHPWPWPWIFKVKFWKCCISGMEWPIDMERKRCESIGCYTHFVTFQHSPHPWPWPWIFKVKFLKSHISGMGWPIYMELKGCKSIGCWTHAVTFNVHLTHDLYLGFSRLKFEKVVSQEWDGRLTWNERDVSRQNVGPMLWLSMFTSSMTLTLDFQGQILKKSNLRNGMADRHGTKGMWVDRMLDSHCDFKLWPHPWPWPWIFKVKYWNCCNLGMGGSTHMEWKGYDVGCTMGLTLGHGAWQMDQPSNGSIWTLQFPTCWPMYGLCVPWSRGWGVLSFSECLVMTTDAVVSTHFEQTVF